MARRFLHVCAGLLVCALAWPRPAAAQRTLETLIDDFDYAVDDIFHIWTRPFHADADDLPAIAAVLGTTGAFMLVDADIQEYLREHPDGALVQAFEPFNEDDWLAKAGDSEHLLQLSGLLYLAGFAADYRPLKEAGLGCASSDFANTTARSLLYDAVARRRPSIRSETTGEMVEPTTDAHQWEVPGGGWDVHSFFGGHAANIMACVSFWNNRFDLGLAEPLLYALAVGVGYGRVVDEMHWTSDTVLGMAWGWAIGWEVSRRYARRDARRAAGRLGARETFGHPIAGAVAGPGGRSTLYLGWRVVH